jgi:hypothetical protein
MERERRRRRRRREGGRAGRSYRVRIRTRSLTARGRKADRKGGGAWIVGACAHPLACRSSPQSTTPRRCCRSWSAETRAPASSRALAKTCRDAVETSEWAPLLPACSADSISGPSPPLLSFQPPSPGIPLFPLQRRPSPIHRAQAPACIMPAGSSEHLLVRCLVHLPIESSTQPTPPLPECFPADAPPPPFNPLPSALIQA